MLARTKSYEPTQNAPWHCALVFALIKNIVKVKQKLLFPRDKKDTKKVTLFPC